MKRALLALLALCLAACSTPGDKETPSSASSPPTATTSTNPAAESRRAEAQRAEREEVTSQLNRIIAEANTQPTLSQKLAVFVTAYCNHRGPENPSGVDGHVVEEINRLYGNAWQAGHQWNTPLAEAAKQQGACPRPSRTIPTPKG